MYALHWVKCISWIFSLNLHNNPWRIHIEHPKFENIKCSEKDWGCSTMIEHSSSMHQVLGSIPSTAKRKKQKTKTKNSTTKYSEIQNLLSTDMTLEKF